MVKHEHDDITPGEQHTPAAEHAAKSRGAGDWLVIALSCLLLVALGAAALYGMEYGNVDTSVARGKVKITRNDKRMVNMRIDKNQQATVLYRGKKMRGDLQLAGAETDTILFRVMNIKLVVDPDTASEETNQAVSNGAAEPGAEDTAEQSPPENPAEQTQMEQNEEAGGEPAAEQAEEAPSQQGAEADEGTADSSTEEEAAETIEDASDIILFIRMPRSGLQGDYSGVWVVYYSRPSEKAAYSDWAIISEDGTAVTGFKRNFNAVTAQRSKLVELAKPGWTWTNEDWRVNLELPDANEQ